MVNFIDTQIPLAAVTAAGYIRKNNTVKEEEEEKLSMKTTDRKFPLLLFCFVF